MSAIVERRKFARVTLKGSVVVYSGEHIQHGRVFNLSEGGLFATTAVTAPLRMLRRNLDLSLRLDAAASEWISAKGQIVRIAAERFAIAFDTAPIALARLVQGMLQDANSRDRVLSVILVDDQTGRRDLIAEAFRSVGCTVIATTTPLEAIVRLGECKFEPDVIAVADSLAAEDATHMRQFVELNHRSSKLVSITDDLTAPDGMLHWLSSADPDGDLGRRIREVLFRRRG
jgi:CheY-like chemotaxis protein